MNVRLLLLAILFITTGSCEKGEETPSYEESVKIQKCYDKDPIVELEWLADLVEVYSWSTAVLTLSIYEYEYFDSTYFASERGSRIKTIYYCNGEIYCSCDSTSQECLIDFNNNATKRRLIWPE